MTPLFWAEVSKGGFDTSARTGLANNSFHIDRIEVDNVPEEGEQTNILSVVDTRQENGIRLLGIQKAGTDGRWLTLHSRARPSH